MIVTYESATIAYMNQQVADIIPINLILLTSFDKNDIIAIIDAIIGNIENIFW